ncbi:MAG TPA: hypothetical protein VFF78_03365, partial [Anaerolineaceae bacterium]|nr:hypothetical protein [Anaerolineaceae bacterium]
MKFLGDIDLEHGELKNAAMHNAASAPSNPVEGQLWFDTTVGVKALKVYTGTAWVLCALGAHTHAGGDITSAVASASNADSADALSGKAVPYGLTLNNHDMLIYNAFNNSYEAIPATSAPSATSIPVTDA